MAKASVCAFRAVSALVCALASCPAAATATSGPTVTVVSRAVEPGEVLRVDIACACDAAPTAMAFDVNVPLTRSVDGARWQGFLGIDVAAAPGSYPLVVTAPRGAAGTTRLQVRPKRFATRTLSVAAAFVDPPASVTERIASEAALMERLFAVVTPRAWSPPFALPLATRPMRNFGSRSIFNGAPRKPHAGIDFRSPAGTVVTAPAPGRVVLAGDLFFTGTTVILDHGGGLYSLFAHLLSASVRAEDVVSHGAPLGRVGATGRATGPHLHWSVRLNGARVDPLSLVEAAGR